MWMINGVFVLRGLLVELMYSDRIVVFRNDRPWGRGDQPLLLLFYLLGGAIILLILRYGFDQSFPLVVLFVLMGTLLFIASFFRDTLWPVLKEKVAPQQWADRLIFTPTSLVICGRAILEIAKARLAWRRIDADRIEIWEHEASTPAKIVDLRCFAEEKRSNLLQQLQDWEGEYPAASVDLK
ncbi:MAG: hypothetical protein AAFW73_22945 [Bacteroidota bacterium]